MKVVDWMLYTLDSTLKYVRQISRSITLNVLLADDMGDQISAHFRRAAFGP